MTPVRIRILTRKILTSYVNSDKDEADLVSYYHGFGELAISSTRDFASRRVLSLVGECERTLGIQFTSFHLYPFFIVNRFLGEAKDEEEFFPLKVNRTDKIIEAVYADSAWTNPDVLRVLPRRSGVVIDSPLEPFLAPHVQHFVDDSDPLISLEGCSVEASMARKFRSAIVVEEEIRSGFSLITILQKLRSSVTESFQIYVLKATLKGLQAIALFAELSERKISVTVGQVI